jgi:hypothetical protein
MNFSSSEVRLDVFMAMKIHVVVFWVVTLCSDMVGYQSFGRPCCFHSVINSANKAAVKTCEVEEKLMQFKERG